MTHVELQFDLGYYAECFDEALTEKYGTTFENGFVEIGQKFEEVRDGRELTVDDVLFIFNERLPFVQDWTKPDRTQLMRKMGNPNRDLAGLIRELGVGGYSLQVITGIVECFRELSLTALVLHHVYPDRFAICSHHLASLLHIEGPTVAQYYIEYCRELKVWGNRNWPTSGVLNVVDAEFALWTWYRMAHAGNTNEGRTHENRFSKDPWIQQRRARRIAKSLGPIDRIDLARSYLETDPTVAAMIAWRELETTMRAILPKLDKDRKERHEELVSRLFRHKTPPAGMDRRHFAKLWEQRNGVMHHGEDVAQGRPINEQSAAKAFQSADEILQKVAEFIEWSAPHDKRRR
jgi:hypothetical protein